MKGAAARVLWIAPGMAITIAVCKWEFASCLLLLLCCADVLTFIGVDEQSKRFLQLRCGLPAP